MKFLMPCSAIVLAGTISSSVIAAGYVQNSNIQKKVFEKVGGGTCEIQTRIFDGSGSETRIYSDPNSSANCKTESFFAVKTETTHTISSKEYAGDVTEYSPGLRIIIDDMEIGDTWSDDTQYIVNGSVQSTIDYSYEVEPAEPFSLDGQTFPNCVIVNMMVNSAEYANLWLCEDVGLVQYVDHSQSETWELQELVDDGSITVVDGSNYIQDSSVRSKTFVNTFAGGSGCDKETRTSSANNQKRVYSNSNGEDADCYTFNFPIDKTDTSFTYLGQKVGGLNISYDPGFPVLVANMAVGESWEQGSTVTNNGNYVGIRNDRFTLQDIDTVNVEADTFDQCLDILWEIDDPYSVDDLEYNLFICPDDGLVKYTTEGQKWELQAISYSSNANTSGGGSFPLSLISILGVFCFAVRRKS